MTKTLLALVADPLLRKAIESVTPHLGYAVEFAGFPDDVVAFLVARQPWLTIIELGNRSLVWRSFVIAAKTSPATRRLPILAVGPEVNTDVLLAANKAGCDAVVGDDTFMDDPAGVIAKYAKVDVSAELQRQSKEPLPELAHKAIEQFNAREYWEQHETFEAAWRAESGPIRQLYQGLLQVGVAYLQIRRGNYAGARKLFQRAQQYLSALPDVSQGVDIAQFKRDAQAAQAELERLGSQRIGEFDPVFFRPIQFTISD